MKNITVLGSTGSIGKNTLDIVRKNPDKLNVKYLSVYSNVNDLIAQVEEFQPEAVVLADESAYQIAKEKISHIDVLFGEEELIRIAGENVDLCINALVGASGVKPTLNAIKNNIDIALANKETLVTAGIVVMAEAQKNDVKIFPIDSEHSAIWQCLVGEDMSTVRNIYVTASGGPFRGRTRDDLKDATIDQALAHPNWKMGSKITIDSATLMNKGFEVIETYWLYNVDVSQIKVVVHPQSIIHSMVEFIDSSFKAQLGMPDMRVPIQYAISYPDRWPLTVENMDLVKISNLTFEEPDMDTFKCLRLAYDALKESGTMPAVLNAANEITNNAFLSGKIKFNQIADINESVMNSYAHNPKPNIDDILEADSAARMLADNLVRG